MKKVTALLTALAIALISAGCGAGSEGSDKTDKTGVIVFAAASLQPALEEIKAAYEKENPDIEIILNCDGSGTLTEQILEGAPCDIFFSAAEEQMDSIDDAGLLVGESRQDVLGNRLVVISRPGSGTEVKGIADLGKAKSLSLAAGSVPAGKYTRNALMKLGILDEAEDSGAYTTAQVAEALGGIAISEQGNVSKVLAEVSEGASEVGTVYLSDTYGHENDVEIISEVPLDLTGEITYPLALIENKDAGDEEKAAAEKVLKALTDEEALKIYEKYLFDTDLNKKQ